MTDAFAPPIYPDETVYSYVARLHLYWGETNHRKTAKRWFGKSPISIDQRLPIGLDFLAKSSGNCVVDLLTNHTYFPLFAAFSSNQERLQRALLSSSGQSVANASSVSQAGFEALGGSWYCPDCVEQDRANFGIAYWHLTHQMHGVTCCPIHAIKLFQMCHSSRMFHLPPQVENKPRLLASTHAIRLAEVILGFSRDYQFVSNDIREDYCSSPIELLHLKRQLLRRNVDLTLLMAKISELSSSIFGRSILSENVVHNLLYQQQYCGHPLKYIFLCYALDQLPFIKEELDESRIAIAKQLEKDRSRCAGLLKAGQYSLREIARRINRSIQFVKAMACQLGVRFQKRTHFVTPDIEARIIARARNGEHRKVIASKEGVSVGTVEHLIQCTPGLSDARRVMKKEERRRSARKAICKALLAQPSLTRIELKHACYNDYTWLYRHDKAWLYQTLPVANNHTKL